ncbi:aspartic peptidase domain-containing protein [Rhodocollybia butyracea]|uniref:Aspartic peptidase domain-containing protein n=1 Tax=Rhodocollybia butyracea TaxID=206335 RepID=A0A9P5PJ25_9AGAR|nr:aspartic peptidase domain-containing protein [Rhodocollybia butyracea]
MLCLVLLLSLFLCSWATVGSELSSGEVANTTEAFIVPISLSSDGESYYAVIALGEIYFRISLDTASSDLWIMASSCSTSACQNTPRYPLTYESATFLAVNDNSTVFGAEYADGTVATGFVAKETLHLSNLTVPNQAFALITNSNVSMIDDISGILGLGFPRISSINTTLTNSTPFFPGLAQQGLLQYPLFGLSLTRNDTGSLSLGAIDSSVVTNLSNVEWNPVVEFSPVSNESSSSSYYQWAIPLQSLAVNGTPITLAPSYPLITANRSIAIFDVGTPGIYGPWADVSNLFSSFSSARLVDGATGQWAVPCDSEMTMSFLFGHMNFTLQPTDYIIGEASGDPGLCLSWPLAVEPSPDGIDWQFGTPFMRTVYTVFSYGIDTLEPPMIGLYPLSNNTSPEVSSVVVSFIESASEVVATTLPNSLIVTPTATTRAYSLNTSVPAFTGGIVSTALATSTYSPIFGAVTTVADASTLNLSAIPLISPPPTVVTLTTTNSAGMVHTTTSHVTIPTQVLGVPPGWNNGGFTARAPVFTLLLSISLPTLLSLVLRFTSLDCL